MKVCHGCNLCKISSGLKQFGLNELYWSVQKPCAGTTPPRLTGGEGGCGESEKGKNCQNHKNHESKSWLQFVQKFKWFEAIWAK